MTLPSFRFLLFLLMAFSPITLFSQIVIKGTVTEEETGEPLIGATVLIKGTTIGQYTDLEGEFHFSEAPYDPNSVLVIRHVGMKTLEFPFPEKMPTNGIWIINTEMEVPFIPDPLPWIYFYEPKYAGDMDIVRPRLNDLRAELSFAAVANQMPGVRWEERGPGGSRRISMRGSLLRSPFGVRNIKAYLGNAPLTSPDGSTPIELLDPATVPYLEVLKGADGSQFGAGTGGSIHANNFEFSSHGPRYRFGLTGGAYGLLRARAQVYLNRNDWGFQAHYIHQQHAGYRAQEANRKDFAVLTGSRIKGDHVVRLQTMIYAGEWELPGALDSLQVVADPRQANPFSQAGDAHVDRKRFRTQIDHNWGTGRWGTSSGLYFNFTSKLNPYATSPFFSGYKDESAMGIGGKVSVEGELKEYLTVSAGAEYQSEGQNLMEFENLDGNPGAMRLQYDTRSSTNLQYAGLEWALSENFLTLRMSRNQTAYSLQEVFSPDSLDDSGDYAFSTVFLPSVTYTRRNPHSNWYQIHLKASGGYAPPSLWELQANANGAGPALEAERALNLELRCHINPRKPRYSRLRIELQTYAGLTYDALLPENLPSGATTFANKGESQQLGAEMLFRLTRIPRHSKTVTQFKQTLTASFQQYTFVDYAPDGIDLSGNRIPGIPEWNINSMTTLNLSNGLSFHNQIGVTSSIPLDDENTVYQNAYALWDAKISYRLDLAPLIRQEQYLTRHPNSMLEMFFGGRNLLGSQYSSYLQLNGFGGRFWNPANPRTAYLGLSYSI